MSLALPMLVEGSFRSLMRRQWFAVDQQCSARRVEDGEQLSMLSQVRDTPVSDASTTRVFLPKTKESRARGWREQRVARGKDAKNAEVVWGKNVM